MSDETATKIVPDETPTDLSDPQDYTDITKDGEGRERRFPIFLIFVLFSL